MPRSSPRLVIIKGPFGTAEIEEMAGCKYDRVKVTKDRDGVAVILFLKLLSSQLLGVLVRTGLCKALA